MRPPTRVSRLALGTAIFAVLALLSAVPVVAQQPDVPETGFSILAEMVAAGIITLVIGGGWILLAEEYTIETTDRIHNDPVETFLYGLAITIALIVIIVGLAITIIGLLLAIPLVIVAAIGGLILAELGYLAVGRLVDDEWAIALVVAIVVAAFAGGVPILGGLVGFVVSCMAFGAVYLEYREDDDPPTDSRTASSPTPATGPKPATKRSEPSTPDTTESKLTAEEGASVETDDETPSLNDRSVSEWDWGLDDEDAEDENAPDGGDETGETGESDDSGDRR